MDAASVTGADALEDEVELEDDDDIGTSGVHTSPHTMGVWKSARLQESGGMCE
jgi:hypothetical protein